MKATTDLPVEMRDDITDRPSAERFLRALHSAGLDHHFDDGAVDCLFGNGVVDRPCAEFIDAQVAKCYAAWKASGADLREDCPIGFLLALMEDAGELPAA